MTNSLRVAFIGWGAINSRVGALLAQRPIPIEIVGVATTGTRETRHLIPQCATLLSDPSQLAAIKPDVVVEAAGRAAIEQWAPAALAAAPVLIVASSSAFVDDTLLTRLAEVAERHGSKILIPPGAIGGIDALAGAAILNITEVVHQIVKPPLAWRSTPAENLLDLMTLKERTTFYVGNAGEAARQYPQNANATVVTALAGIGLGKTRVELIADPEALTNGHRIVASGDFGRLEVILENNALKDNPKSSELTALSLVRLIEQRAKVILI